MSISPAAFQDRWITYLINQAPSMTIVSPVWNEEASLAK
jgi:hypothetical protein